MPLREKQVSTNATVFGLRWRQRYWMCQDWNDATASRDGLSCKTPYSFPQHYRVLIWHPYSQKKWVILAFLVEHGTKSMHDKTRIFFLNSLSNTDNTVLESLSLCFPYVSCGSTHIGAFPSSHKLSKSGNISMAEGHGQSFLFLLFCYSFHPAEKDVIPYIFCKIWNSLYMFSKTFQLLRVFREHFPW